MMRNNGSRRASTLLAILLTCALAPQAEAQSLFQSLFGNLFKSAPPIPVPPPAPSVDAGTFRQGANFPVQNFSPRNEQSRQSFSGGAYRTVCVRACDGYYFPISGSASRSKFNKDAEACAARCSGAQLYYLPKESEDMAAMVDLTGHRYDQLRNAFLYRKKLIDGCACRPMPWSAAERARHNRYAYAAEILKQTNERARRLREGEIAGVENSGSQGNDHVSRDIAEVDAEEGQLGEENPNEAAKAGEEADSAYVAVVNAAISAASSETQTGMDDGKITAENVTYAPRQAKKRLRTYSGKTSRAPKTRRMPAKSNGWAFAGGGKYRWPGDR